MIHLLENKFYKNEESIFQNKCVRLESSTNIFFLDLEDK